MSLPTLSFPRSEAPMLVRSRLDIVREVSALATAYPGLGRLFPKIDPDLEQEAGMDGNLQRLLQAARTLDAAGPLPLPVTDADNAKALLRQVLEILPYAVPVLESAGKDETARAVRACITQLRDAAGLLSIPTPE
jgi:hypothetical protein